MYLVRLHDGVGLKVGCLLHEASHQQHGLAFGLQTAKVRHGLIIGEALGHTLLQDDQGLVYIALVTDQQVCFVLYFVCVVLCVYIEANIWYFIACIRLHLDAF